MLVSMKDYCNLPASTALPLAHLCVADNQVFLRAVDGAEATNTPTIIAIIPANMILWAMPFRSRSRNTQRSPVRLYCTSIMVPL